MSGAEETGAPVLGAFTFWPRAGISYVSLDSGGPAGYTTAASLEAACVITGPHFGFTLVPTADIGFAAKGDNKMTQRGLQAGLIGWLKDTPSRWSLVELRADATEAAPAVSTKIGRNEPCPCGSGKKYKKCCGGAQAQ